MAHRILIIDADPAFAAGASVALAKRGAETRACTDGQSGLEEARAWRPDGIVLCVELPNLSGYSVCNKLKKDEELRRIPLLLTSAEATEDTFEQHRKLRTRADEYLLKPFDPAALVRSLARLVALPPDRADESPLGEIGHEDLAFIDRVFDELAAGADAGPAGEPVRMPVATVVARVDRGPEAHAADADADALRARTAELEAEIGRLREELREANAERTRLGALERSMQEAIVSARAATERAGAAEARLGAVEVRLRQADALRDKARRALSVVLQALEELTPRTNPAEPPPRRE